MKLKLLRYLPVIAWMTLIFTFSSQPNLPPSGGPQVDFVVKKSAHIMEYMMLNLLWYFALAQKMPLNSLLFSLIFAFTDEIHQLFVPGRTGTIRDVFIDLGGISVMSVLIVKLQLWKILLFPRLSKTPKK